MKGKRHIRLNRILTIVFWIAVASNLNASSLFRTTTAINLRSRPGTNSSSIGVIQSGEEVSLIERSDSTWFKVEYNGAIGFVSQKFLTPVETTIDTAKTIAVPQTNNGVTDSDTNLFFGFVILLGFVIFMAYFARSRRKPVISQKSNTIPPPVLYKENKREQAIKSIANNIKIEVTTSNSNKRNMDNSIIDVTGTAYRINPSNNSGSYNSTVPYWAHRYVYSYSEINNATNEIKKFYEVFKGSFLKGEYLNLNGNTNYAFILMFDLLNQYEEHKDNSNLENQIRILGEKYPITKSYGVSLLLKKMEASGDWEYEKKLIEKENIYIAPATEYWDLGKKYRIKLNLNEEQVNLLDKIWYPTNNFCSIEYCLVEILKLYIGTITELKAEFQKKGENIDNQFILVADIIAKKHYRYRQGSSNYAYCINSTVHEIYSNIFKYCENAVREKYGHKRKLSTSSIYTSKAIIEEYEAKIIPMAVDIINKLLPSVALPDKETEIELNAQNVSRWKIKFEEITHLFQGNVKQYFDDIQLLGNLNRKNPSIENIFYDASKFISKYDKEISLKLYIYYLYYDFKSPTINNKQLTKTIQKNLFKIPEQLKDFETLINEFIKDKDLEKALEAVPKIYAVKRKKIALNHEAIKEAQQKYTGTVELLNEYLKDDNEVNDDSKHFSESDDNEVKIHLAPETYSREGPQYIDSIPFNPIQLATLDIFTKSNFSVPQSEVEAFAKSRGVFKNQLIESINEACFEDLNDVLIEEEEDLYLINRNNYQLLLAK